VVALATDLHQQVELFQALQQQDRQLAQHVVTLTRDNTFLSNVSQSLHPSQRALLDATLDVIPPPPLPVIPAPEAAVGSTTPAVTVTSNASSSGGLIDAASQLRTVLSPAHVRQIQARTDALQGTVEALSTDVQSHTQTIVALEAVKAQYELKHTNREHELEQLSGQLKQMERQLLVQEKAWSEAEDAKLKLNGELHALKQQNIALQGKLALSSSNLKSTDSIASPVSIGSTHTIEPVVIDSASMSTSSVTTNPGTSSLSQTAGARDYSNVQ